MQFHLELPGLGLSATGVPALRAIKISSGTFSGRGPNNNNHQGHNVVNGASRMHSAGDSWATVFSAAWHPSDLTTRLVEAGCRTSLGGGSPVA